MAGWIFSSTQWTLNKLDPKGQYHLCTVSGVLTYCTVYLCLGLCSMECKHTHCVSAVLPVCTGLSDPAPLTTTSKNVDLSSVGQVSSQITRTIFVVELSVLL